MADKRFYWLKLQEDFFKSIRIKKLRRLAGGDTFTIIYLKMQLLSLSKGGVLEYTGLEDSFASEIALDIDEDEDNVQITINYLLSCGLLVEGESGEYSLPFVIQNTCSESKWAEKKRVQRSKEGQLEDKLGTNGGHCPRDIDIEIEIDKDIDKDINTMSDKIREIVEYLNLVCGTHYRYQTESTKKHIRARLNEKFTVDDFKTVIDKKHKEWFGTEMQKYLCPETLFGSKFEKYLNQSESYRPNHTSNVSQSSGYDFDELRRMAMED